MSGRPFATHDAAYWLRGALWGGVTLALAFGLRMLEWPCWQDPEFRLGSEMLLATHDAYHWVAGAEGFSFGVGHPMSELLRHMAGILGTYPAAVAFWFPAALSSLVALLVFVWVWALGGMEAGVAAGLLTSLSPGFLARTLLGYYDTDLVTLFFPLLMALAPACWAMRHMVLPYLILRRLMPNSGFGAARRLWGGVAAHGLERFHPAFEIDRMQRRDASTFGNPLRWPWVLLLGLSGVVSWWAQEWHSVFPYLLRYNILLLGALCVALARRGRRAPLLLGSLAYALPALAGPCGLLLTLCVLACGPGVRPSRVFRAALCRPWVLLPLWIGTLALAAEGEIWHTMLAHVGAYLKRGADVKDTGMAVVGYPSVAQSIVEVQDLTLAAVLAYFHPWTEAAVLGLAGFCAVILRRPGALFLLPLAALGLLSTKMGGRMVMFGAPIVAIGLSLPLFWLLRACLARWRRGAPSRPWAGLGASLLLIVLLVAPFVELPSTMSQGPMINRRHATALTSARTVTPPGSMLWLWWDWGYAAHHFARRATIADGAQHAGPSLYLPAAVLATDNPRFARQIIRYTALHGNEPGKVFAGLDNAAAQALMNRLRSSSTPLVEGRGRQFLVVSFETLRLGFWISNFGNWNFVRQQGESAALSIVTQGLSYQLATGAVRLPGMPPVYASSIAVLDETGVTRRDYLQEWFDRNPRASAAQRQSYLESRRNIHFIFNRVTGEKLAMDQRLYNSLMVRLLIGDPLSPHISPYFKLVYDNVFARIYEVL